MLQTVLVVQCFARGTLRRTKIVDKSSELLDALHLFGVRKGGSQQ